MEYTSCESVGVSTKAGQLQLQLLIEWPRDEPEPTKCWLSTLPPTITRRAMVDQAKLRWRIERDYQDLKQELGLGHHELRRVVT